MTPSNEKAAGGGAVERIRRALETWEGYEGAVFTQADVLELLDSTESALKLQADRIAELEGALERIWQSSNASWIRREARAALSKTHDERH